MLSRLSIALAQIGDNTSANLLHKISQIIYFLYRAEEITKKVYNNITNPIKLLNSIDTTFMNSDKY